MKKIISLIIAGAAALTMGTAVLAAPETTTASAKPEPATLSFDTDACMKYIHTFGNASDTNLKVELADGGAISGRSLKLSEDFKDPVSNQYGGIYFEAADFGLDDFAGHTLNVNIKIDKAVNKSTDVLQLFADGDQWISSVVNTSNSGNYFKASVTVPAEVKNNKLGLSIPITDGFSGEVCRLDDVTIVDNYGVQIANIGDEDTSVAEAPNGVLSVLSTILFIILIIAIIGVIVWIVLKLVRRYR